MNVLVDFFKYLCWVDFYFKGIIFLKIYFSKFLRWFFFVKNNYDGYFGF